MEEQELLIDIDKNSKELLQETDAIISDLDSIGNSVLVNIQKISDINQFFETSINSGIERLRIYDLEFPLGMQK